MLTGCVEPCMIRDWCCLLDPQYPTYLLLQTVLCGKLRWASDLETSCGLLLKQQPANTAPTQFVHPLHSIPAVLSVTLYCHPVPKRLPQDEQSLKVLTSNIFVVQQLETLACVMCARTRPCSPKKS